MGLLMELLDMIMMTIDNTNNETPIETCHDTLIAT